LGFRGLDFTFVAGGILVAGVLGLVRLVVVLVTEALGAVRQLGFRRASAGFFWRVFGLGVVVLWLVSLDWIADFVDFWFEDLGSTTPS
jgi:hypothetical protein